MESLESELQRVRRLAAERSLVASNRSMEISELRGSLSRVEQAVSSPPKELPLQTPGYETNQNHSQGRVHINRMGSVTFNNTGSAFRGGGGVASDSQVTVPQVVDKGKYEIGSICGWSASLGAGA